MTIQQSLLRRLAKKKNKKQNGFTLIELMVVIVIVGVLTAVALPQLNAAQDRARSSAAKQEAVNAAKTCSIALIGGDSTEGDVAASADGDDIANGEITCAANADFVFTGGGDEWTVSLDDGIPGTPE